MPSSTDVDLELGPGVRPELDTHAAETIEDYPLGYPRFAALIASHPSFQICRRFSLLRSRLLLLKQDRLAQMEAQLEAIDRNENSRVYLGSVRLDGNPARRAILAEADEALKEYDDFVERQSRFNNADPAPPSATINLKRWMQGNECIAPNEAAYLDRAGDLLTAGAESDNATKCIENFVEGSLVALKRHVPGRWRIASRDPAVHIFHPSSTRSAGRALVAPFIAMLLLSPVIVCNMVQALSSRLVIVSIATTSFIAVVSSLTRAGTVELIVAGATYTTVLVVFISGTTEISASGHVSGLPHGATRSMVDGIQ